MRISNIKKGGVCVMLLFILYSYKAQSQSDLPNIKTEYDVEMILQNDLPFYVGRKSKKPYTGWYFYSFNNFYNNKFTLMYIVNGQQNGVFYEYTLHKNYYYLTKINVSQNYYPYYTLNYKIEKGNRVLRDFTRYESSVYLYRVVKFNKNDCKIITYTRGENEKIEKEIKKQATYSDEMIDYYSNNLTFPAKVFNYFELFE